MTDTLHVRLWPGKDFAAEGRPIRATRPLDARFRLGDSAVHLDLALPDITRAELRWAADRVFRRLRAMFTVSKMTLAARPEIDDDTLLTLALDQHQASNGRVTVVGNEKVAALLALVGPAEDGYRGWVNEDATKRTSLAIARDVERFARATADVEATVLAEPELKKHGLNLLLAVGSASTLSPPRLVVARYTPDGRSDDTLMLLGKGITFDSGGINVKPYSSHVAQMKNDMAGAALAFWLFRTLVEQRFDRPLLLVLPTCENPIGELAMRPGTVLTSYRGITVRVDHTDAEGRLVLADGLAWAGDEYSPAEVISFATLTTAALNSYGPYTTPVHFPTPQWERRLQAASERTGEDLHFFPYRLWHAEANRDREATLKNTARLPGAASQGAGSRNAAHFLCHFTSLPLMHLDIFGSTWNWASDAPGAGYGATGAPMRTLLLAFLGEAAGDRK